MTSNHKPPDFPWSERERALLTAARQDRMPGELERGMRSALTQRMAAAPARPSLRLGRALFSRASLWGTLGAALLGVTSYVVLRATPPRPAATVLQPLTASALSAPEPAPPRAAVALASGAPSSAPEPLPAAVRSSAPRTPVVRPDPLRQELQLLERARTALRRGELAEAARQLDAYAARFQRGVLRPESEALRIELDMRRGQPALAQRNAERFGAAYPEHPLRERVQNLVARP